MNIYRFLRELHIECPVEVVHSMTGPHQALLRCRSHCCVLGPIGNQTASRIVDRLDQRPNLRVSDLTLAS